MTSPTVSLRSLVRAALVAGGRAVRGDGGLVLAYHDVRTEAAGYHVTPDQLARHLRLVRSAGFHIVSVPTLVTTFETEGDLHDLAAVTFDDALIGVAELALPVLQALDVPATVFAVAERLGGEPDWTAGEQRTLTPAELSALARAPGITIGSHGATHRSLPSLDAPELQRELGGARRTLSDLVGQPVDFVAYPFGHHDGRVRHEARAAGYRAGFTFLNGRVGAGNDPFRLPRLTMGAHHHRARLAHHLGRTAVSWPDTQQAEVG